MPGGLRKSQGSKSQVVNDGQFNDARISWLILGNTEVKPFSIVTIPNFEVHEIGKKPNDWEDAN